LSSNYDEYPHKLISSIDIERKGVPWFIMSSCPPHSSTLKLRELSNIINIDKSRLAEGTHWVYCYLRSDYGFIYYFDSLGSDLGGYPIKSVRKYADVHNLRLDYNKTNYQPAKSWLCGYYALALAKWFDKAKPTSIDECRQIVVANLGKKADDADIRKTIIASQ